MKPQIVVIGTDNKYSAYEGKELKERIRADVPLSPMDIERLRKSPKVFVDKLLSEGDDDADSPGPASA